MKSRFFVLFVILCLFVSLKTTAMSGTNYCFVERENFTHYLEIQWRDYSGDHRSDPVSAYIFSVKNLPISGIINLPDTIMHQLSYSEWNTQTSYWKDVPYLATFNIKGIHYLAFSDFKDLTEITIPQNMGPIVCRYKDYTDYNETYESGAVSPVNPYDELGQNLFRECKNLSTITVDENNELYYSPDNCNALINRNSDILIVGCKNSFIPECVKGIGSYAFYGCSDISTVDLPEGVTIIGYYAFGNCTGLTSFTFPQSVEEIRPTAFSGCTNLSDVYFYSKPKIISETFGNLYNNLDNRRSCHINEVFDNIENITLHVRDVDIEAYRSDPNWTGFKDIVPIKTTVFNLIYYVDGKEYKTVQYKCDDDIIPLEDPTKEGYTFSGWSYPYDNGRDYIVEEIPNKMPGKDIKVYGTFTRNEVKENSIIYWALDDHAAVIGNDNAAGDVKIAASVTFNANSVPVTDIVDFSFKNNTDITSVVTPESVRKIGDEAFYGCKNLATIELGKSVNQIEPRAFAGIDKLTDVTVYAEEVPETDRTAFENSYTEDYVTLHVPGGSLEKYKEAAPWKNFKEIVAIEGTETEPAKYTLTYQVDGETYQEYELEEGEEITAIEAPTKEGYTFSGWSTIPATMPAEDVTITGTFTKNEPKEEEVDTGEDVIKITSAGQTTWCSKYDLDFTDIDGLKAYIAPGYDRESGTIWLMRVFKVPAGEGILLMGDAKEYKVPHKPTSTYYTNMFVGTIEPKTIYESEGEFTNYYLSSGTSGVGFYRVTDAEGVQLKANRAYLPLKTSTQASTRGFVGMDFGEDGTTGMRNLTPALSKCEGVYYNLQGQRVDKPGKGLYILNGKKVVIR